MRQSESRGSRRPLRAAQGSRRRGTACPSALAGTRIPRPHRLALRGDDTELFLTQGFLRKTLPKELKKAE